MPNNAAFTLLEIAMVLVIIGLLAAGVMVGRSITESSALQSAVADFDNYRQAVLSYREKYSELPGDHSGATYQTSTDAGCPAPTASNTLTPATCNGNGDGMIGDDNTGEPLGAFTSYNEPLLVWQHLMNAELIKGKFTGRRSTASNEISPDVNVPASKINNAAFILRNFPTSHALSDPIADTYFKANYGHVFFLGAAGASAAYPLNGAALTTEQAKSIDLKIDDGKPGLGKVLTSPYSVRPCPTNAGETDAMYDGSISGIACALIFITGF